MTRGNGTTRVLTAALAVARAEWPATAVVERRTRDLLARTAQVAGWPAPAPQGVRVATYAPGTRRRLPPRVHPRSLVDDLVAGRVGLVVATAEVVLPHPPRLP